MLHRPQTDNNACTARRLVPLLGTNYGQTRLKLVRRQWLWAWSGPLGHERTRTPLADRPISPRLAGGTFVSCWSKRLSVDKLLVPSHSSGWSIRFSTISNKLTRTSGSLPQIGDVKEIEKIFQTMCHLFVGHTKYLKPPPSFGIKKYMSYQDSPLRVALSVNIRNRAILKHVILVVTGILGGMAFSKSNPIDVGMVDINTLCYSVSRFFCTFSEATLLRKICSQTPYLDVPKS